MNDIISLYRSGLSCSKIAKIVGLSSTSVRRHLILNNEPLRSNSRKGRGNLTPKNLESFVGQKFGLLEVVGFDVGGLRCSCSCGNHLTLKSSRLTRSGQTSCGCSKRQVGPNAKKWKGGRHISMSYFNSIKRGADKRKISFHLTIPYLDYLLETQTFKCAISKVEISVLPPYSASLDRIDSSLGYVEGNVQWLHKTVNEMKWDYTQEEFIRWCKLVASATV